MYNNPIIVGLDIGTTKICAIVGQKNLNGKIEILGMGKTESLGVMRGVVANIETPDGAFLVVPTWPSGLMAIRLKK